MKDLANEIKAYALQNAIEHGRADASKVLPKLFQHGLGKNQIKEVMPKIKEIVDEVNSTNPKKQEEIFVKKYKSLVKIREQKQKDLPDLPQATVGKVVTRIAPEPSKYMHAGHALSFLLNYIYAKKYKGNCKLRFEDTNPDKVSKEYVDKMLEDLEYLGIKPKSIRYVSDDMKKMYDYAEKLIKQKDAYMCFCDRETIQKNRRAGKECVCRFKEAKEHMANWKNFVKGNFKEGETVLRIKGNMMDKNHVMRDSVLFRMISAKHYRHGTKYKVWPLYDFYNPIEDSLMGVTHILRSNEFDLRVPLQNLIQEKLGLKKQIVVQYGRFNVTGSTTKGREIRELIESKKLIGWDDPRLVTLKALIRRGIQSETFEELVKEIGLSKYQVNINFDRIAHANRVIIDSKADRYSFIQDPIEISVSGFDKKETVIPFHPERKESRQVKIGKIFISGDDFKSNKGKEVRLLHLYNIKLDTKSKVTELHKIDRKMPKINWVSENVRAKILMPDGKWLSGLAEEAVKKFKKGKIIQFERFGFVRFDKEENGIYEFWFGHK